MRTMWLQVSELREDLRTARDEASRARNEQEATTGQQKAMWAEERRGLEQRAEELAARLSDLSQTHEAMITAQKKVSAGAEFVSRWCFS